MWTPISEEAIEVDGWRTTLRYDELVRPDGSTGKVLHV